MVVSVGVTLAQHQMDVINNSVAFTYVTPVQVIHTTHPVNTPPCQYTLSMHSLTHIVNTQPCQYTLATHLLTSPYTNHKLVHVIINLSQYYTLLHTLF